MFFFQIVYLTYLKNIFMVFYIEKSEKYIVRNFGVLRAGVLCIVYLISGVIFM